MKSTVFITHAHAAPNAEHLERTVAVRSLIDWRAKVVRNAAATATTGMGADVCTRPRRRRGPGADSLCSVGRDATACSG